MPLFVPKTLLQSAQGGGQTKRYREFVIAYFEGEGAVAVPIGVWTPAAAWAHGRQPGNRMRDRGALLMRLDVLVTRRGTTATSTTGGMIPLARLRNAMKSEGLDLKEWNFPPDSVLDLALDPGMNDKDEDEAAAEGAPGQDAGVGTFVRIDSRAARSSSGYEVRILDDSRYEYRQAQQAISIHGVPGGSSGRRSFLLKPGAFDSWLAAEGEDPAQARARAARNFRAAVAFLGVELLEAKG